MSTLNQINNAYHWATKHEANDEPKTSSWGSENNEKHIRSVKFFFSLPCTQYKFKGIKAEEITLVQPIAIWVHPNTLYNSKVTMHYRQKLKTRIISILTWFFFINHPFPSHQKKQMLKHRNGLHNLPIRMNDPYLQIQET